MESALDAATGELVDAVLLQSMPEVEKRHYLCHGCGVRMLPASYHPSNLVSPYFTVGRSGAHLGSCDVAEEPSMASCSAELHIPGVKTTKCCTVFKKLKWDELLHYPEPRIFYAALRWTKPVEDDVSLDLAFDAGLREGGRLIAGQCLKKGWGAWNSARKTVVRRELLDAQLRARQAFSAGSKRVKAFVYFIGAQDLTDRRVFRVDDHRLLCCIAEEIIYPKL